LALFSAAGRTGSDPKLQSQENDVGYCQNDARCTESNAAVTDEWTWHEELEEYQDNSPENEGEELSGASPPNPHCENEAERRKEECDHPGTSIPGDGLGSTGPATGVYGHGKLAQESHARGEYGSVDHFATHDVVLSCGTSAVSCMLLLAASVGSILCDPEQIAGRILEQRERDHFRDDSTR